MKTAYLFFIIFIATPFVVFPQNQVIKVPLKIEPEKKLSVCTWSDILAFDKQQIITKLPTGDILKIERSANKKDLFVVTISKSSGKSLNDATLELGVEDTKTFSRRIVFKNGTSAMREFGIISKRDVDGKRDIFYIKANYAASGVFQLKNCKVSLSLFDLIPNGDFTDDFRQGQNLGIDKNNDGEYGKGEWLYSDSIIDLCGKNYLISNIAQNGKALSLKRTTLQNVRLFDKSPKLDFVLVNTKSLSSDMLEGKPYLIDFWASWCAICIAKMPQIKELEKTLPIIYFNTDIVERKQVAVELIKKLNILDASVLKSSPNAHNFYKSYQRFYSGMPFYVLIDSEGRFRYGGGGGDDLKELKEKIAELNKQQ
jgi:thiol-disulfide isomerase/thioredoxin